MIRNNYNIYIIKKKGKFLQQCATPIDTGFCPFLVDTSTKLKKPYINFLISVGQILQF